MKTQENTFWVLPLDKFDVLSLDIFHLKTIEDIYKYL